MNLAQKLIADILPIGQHLQCFARNLMFRFVYDDPFLLMFLVEMTRASFRRMVRTSNQWCPARFVPRAKLRSSFRKSCQSGSRNRGCRKKKSSASGFAACRKMQFLSTLPTSQLHPMHPFTSFNRLAFLIFSPYAKTGFA